MKSRKIGFLFLLGLLICLTSCGHTHNYAADLLKDDTNHWYECECGDKKDVTAHDYTIAGEVTKEPTCEGTGTQVFSCICGATTEKEIPAKGHSFSTELSKDETTHWYACSDCDARKDEAAHDYTIAGEVTKEPTCEGTGTQVFSCICGATTEKEIPAKGHKYDNLETNWENYVTDVKSDSPTRYQIISHTSADGLYLKIEQYVNNVIIATDPSDWNTTHVEMELWNHCIGYGWDGTYFGFFADGSFYINNWNNCSGVYNCAEVIENPSGSTYAYTISYNIFIAFPNNLDNPQDDSYAYCQFLFHTPEEDNTGYENAKVIVKDDWRSLWTDNCNSYEIHSNGITRKDGAN
ncbi:MAG TPA: hypothetical protein GX708_01345 [Gallicola sp.]|nr:hypothetical protein [Gallicola sp.]